MTRLEHVSWLSDAQREVLAKHHIRSLESLASFELRTLSPTRFRFLICGSW